MKNENLHKQERVFIYSVGTDAFYNEAEQTKADELKKFKDSITDMKKEAKVMRKERSQLIAQKKEMKGKEFKQQRKDLQVQIDLLRNGIKELSDTLSREQQLKDELKQLLAENNQQRELNPAYLNDKNVIALFESTFSRVLGMTGDEVNLDVIIVDVYYYQVLKDLLHDGFTLGGVKYRYFSSSSGQIRNKKCVFVKDEVWKKHQGTLMCGLTIDDINSKGGMNVNKLLAYLALNNSSTVEWKGFDIDRCIVVEDFETKVNGMVDYIDKDFNVHRKEMPVPINHMDGAGIMLPTVSTKAFMCRLPFVKGLLIPMNFKLWVDKHKDKGASTKIKDIYGKEWDIIEDRISIIFTRSQFKLAKYYELDGEEKINSWDNYKTKFKENNCQAAKCHVEEDEFTDATISYQILQTLYKMDDKSLSTIAERTNEDIASIGSDPQTMLKVLGVSKKSDNYYQRALAIYPEMLNDEYTKKMLSDAKRSMVKEARAGKLRMDASKYTFLIPDVYAFCERLFCRIENPTGLLKDGEVFCKLYDNGQKLDVLRSPHLYLEHQPNTNVIDDEKKKWFITNGIFTSCHSLISKVLQFDNDGDRSLVVSHNQFVLEAEKHMEGIDPLYYEMGVAKKVHIDADSIYDSLTAAFNANIGEISNSISKVFSKKVDDEALKVSKLLVKINNEIIDYAKTLHKTEQPPHVKEMIKQYTGGKLPNFFQWAKDKEKDKVEELNESVVNRLTKNKIIKDKRITFKNVPGKFNHRLLMKNSRVDITTDEAQAIINTYTKLNKNKKWIMKEEKQKDSSIKYDYVWECIKRDLLKVNDDIQYVTDVLVRYLYETKSDNKETLWKCFGDVILDNLERKLNGTAQCSDCGDRFEKKNNKHKCCDKCAKNRKRNVVGK